MQSLKSLSDNELLTKIKSLAQEERKLTLEILHYLREVESRRLFALRAYSSLHEFCVKELGYSSGAAYRRIESMRLLKDVPKAEEKILSGELNLSVLSKAQTFIKQEKYDVAQKEELLESLSGKSTREVEKELVTRAPQSVPKEKVKQVTETKMSVQFIADEETMKLLQQLKQPGEDLGTVIKRLAKHYLKKQIPVRAPAPGPNLNTRYVRKQDKFEVRVKAGHQCEYQDSLTKKRCEASTGLQFDHIRPYMMGGITETKNLQLLCAAHNRLKGVLDYGQEKMRATTTPALNANRALQ